MNDNDLDNRTVQQLKDYVDDRISQLHDEQIEETLSLLRSLGVSRDRADQAADRIMAVSNVDRRTALQIVAAAAVGSSIGAGGMFAMTDSAQAAASTTDAEGDVGTPSDRVDVFADAIRNRNYVEPQETASAGSSYNADLTVSNYHKVTMTGDVTFDFTNPHGSDVNSLVLHLVQDSTGGRTPSFTPTVVWSGGSAPSWSTSANAEDVVTFVHDQDGSQWLGLLGGTSFA